MFLGELGVSFGPHTASSMLIIANFMKIFSRKILKILIFHLFQTFQIRGSKHQERTLSPKQRAPSIFEAVLAVSVAALLPSLVSGVSCGRGCRRVVAQASGFVSGACYLSFEKFKGYEFSKIFHKIIS